jgi:two-component system KDP operon response regulator KdpE
VGSLVLSAADHSVTRDGRRAYLSPIEFRLLATLASSPGKVLTHQTLMSRVWGAEYVDARHYLRVYVRYLREKLEDDPTNPQLILSEWGVGYRLQLPEPAPESIASAPSRSFRRR